MALPRAIEEAATSRPPVWSTAPWCTTPKPQPVPAPPIETDPARKGWVDRQTRLTLADMIGQEHPHPLDQTDPATAGRAVARIPGVRRELLDLLEALDLLDDPADGGESQ